MILNRQDIQLYESARLKVLRKMHNITRFDQRIHHINREKLLKIYSMATALEQIMRRTIAFVTKVIIKSIPDSPERMMMGSPQLVWKKDDLTKEIKTNNWNPGYAKTLAMYFEERAMQLYYHVKILKEPTHIYDPKRIIRALLSFKQTIQFDMTYKHPTWMELMKEEPALWESVVQYGQFQSIPPEETEQMKRQRRKNTFPKTVPATIVDEYGSIPLFIQKIKEDVQLQEGEDEEEDEDAAEKEAEAVEEEMPIMLERNNFEELTHTVAWLNCCSVNYLAGWIGVMILALYLCIEETIFGV